MENRSYWKTCCVGLFLFLNKITSLSDKGYCFDILFLNFSKSNNCISHDILIKIVVSDKHDGAHIHTLLQEWRTMLLFSLPHCPFPLPYHQGVTCQAKLIEENCNVLISCCQDLCSGHWEDRQTCDVESREICNIIKEMLSCELTVHMLSMFIMLSSSAIGTRIQFSFPL